MWNTCGTGYHANKEEDREYVLLPQQNFNACFGNTNFSQKWVAALANTLVEKKCLNGVSKYRVKGNVLMV